MRQARFKPRCLRDLKIIKRRGLNEDRLYEVLELLMRDGRLQSSFKPHKLSGIYEGLWECHVWHDWLLIYNVTDKEILLARTGTHADLFE